MQRRFDDCLHQVLTIAFEGSRAQGSGFESGAVEFSMPDAQPAQAAGVQFKLGAWRRSRGLKLPSGRKSALKRTDNPTIAPTGNRALAGFSCQTPVSTGGRAIRPQPEVDPRCCTLAVGDTELIIDIDEMVAYSIRR